MNKNNIIESILEYDRQIIELKASNNDSWEARQIGDRWEIKPSSGGGGDGECCGAFLGCGALCVLTYKCGVFPGCCCYDCCGCGAIT